MNSNNENKEYELINLEFEYPGINGGVKWAVISDLSMEELMRKYGDELEHYSPVILLSVEQGEIFKEYHRNEHKHEMRRKRTYSQHDYESGAWLYQHLSNMVHILNKARLDEEEIVDHVLLRQALEHLSEKQRRRCNLYYFYGMSEEEIARIEGVSQQAVNDTLKSAYKAIKAYLEA